MTTQHSSSHARLRVFTATKTKIKPTQAAIELIVTGTAEARFIESPSIDTKILNTGTHGNAYHANALVNGFTTLKSGAQGWTFADIKDYIEIPSGIEIDDLTKLTLEFLFFLTGDGGGKSGRLWAKRQNLGTSITSDDPFFEVWIDDNEHSLVINRNTLTGEVVQWKTNAGTIVQSVWNYLQIVWDGTASPIKDSGPVVYLNNEKLKVKATKYGHTLWASDRGNAAFVGNRDMSGGYNINGILALYRMYPTPHTLSRAVTNYLADIWRTHDPRTGAVVVPPAGNRLTKATVSASPQGNPVTDQFPFLTIGKNMNGIDVDIDYSKIVTQLSCRGSGSNPSVLTLANPNFYPVQQLFYYRYADQEYAYFQLSGNEAYSSYAGYTGAGDPLPAGTFVRGPENNSYGSQPDESCTRYLIYGQNQAIGVGVAMTDPYRVPGVSFYMKRMIYDQDAVNRRTHESQFQVGLYTTKNDGGGRVVPDHGPLIWAYGNLSKISTDDYAWYFFPMQEQLFEATKQGIWMMWVISPYPISSGDWSTFNPCADESDENKKEDALAFMGAQTSHGGQFVAWTDAGINSTDTSKGQWAEVGILDSNNKQIGIENIAFNMILSQTDYTSSFVQSNDEEPGRWIKCRLEDLPANTGPYYVHYKHNPYLTDGAAYAKYGRIRGTWSDTSLFSQFALMKGGAQYLKSVSQPIVTTTVSAVDLYNIDPYVNWAEELKLGGTIYLFDDALGIHEEAIISKINYKNLDIPHEIELQLNNVNLNTAKLLSQVEARQQTEPKYVTGQTVSTPYTATTQADHSTPGILYFNIKDNTQLVHSVKLTVNQTPYQVTGSSGTSNDGGFGTMQIEVDGNPVLK